MKRICVVGYGYTGQAISRRLEGASTLRILSRHPQNIHDHDALDFTTAASHALLTSEVIISTAPPLPNGQDPLLTILEDNIWQSAPITKIIYLSSTAVYGNHNGRWVSEESPCLADEKRGLDRLKVEQQWLELSSSTRQVTILRCAGIYGPGRNAIQRIHGGKCVSCYKPNHYFSRIHIDDLTRFIMVACHKPLIHTIYNLADDCPSPSHTVDTYAASLLQIPAPKLIPETEMPMTDMMRSFYNNNRRVSNARLHPLNGFKLNYPSYEEGLLSILSPLHLEKNGQ